MENQNIGARDTGPMPSKLELLTPALEQGLPVGEDIPSLLDDPERIEHLRQTLRGIAGDDLVVEMVGDRQFRRARHGVEGFIDGWRDWAETFESFRVEIDDVLESGPHLVTLVRQIGRPRGTAAEMQNEGAGVWTFDGERLVRVEFHLDREMALRSAGIDLQSGQT
jgi:ketosteroid isomerase-like protein